MQLSIKIEKLIQPLSVAVGVTENKQTMPILAHMYFRVKNNQMTLIGTDTEVEITTHITLDEESPDMEGTLPARKFFNICRSFPSDMDIQLSYDKNQFVLVCGTSKFHLSSFSSADFPMLEVPAEEERQLRLSISQQELRKHLASVFSCMASQDVRYYLNAALFDFSPDGLHIVATDGHKLSVAEKSAPQLTADKVQAIVPRKGVIELLRLLEHQDEPVDLVFYPHFMQVVTPSFSCGCKLIDANFPDYARVIPTESDKKALLDVRAFDAALRRCAILATDKVQKAALKFESDRLRISTVNRIEEEGFEDLPISYEGEPLTIHFNIPYFNEVIGTMKGEKLRIEMRDPNSSALLQDEEDDTTLFVIMPMKV